MEDMKVMTMKMFAEVADPFLESKSVIRAFAIHSKI